MALAVPGYYSLQKRTLSALEPISHVNLLNCDATCTDKLPSGLQSIVKQALSHLMDCHTLLHMPSIE